MLLRAGDNVARVPRVARGLWQRALAAVLAGMLNAAAAIPEGHCFLALFLWRRPANALHGRWINPKPSGGSRARLCQPPDAGVADTRLAARASSSLAPSASSTRNSNSATVKGFFRSLRCPCPSSAEEST